MAKAATIVLEKDGFIIDGVSKFNQFVVAHKEVQYGLEVLRCLIQFTEVEDLLFLKTTFVIGNNRVGNIHHYRKFYDNVEREYQSR